MLHACWWVFVGGLVVGSRRPIAIRHRHRAYSDQPKREIGACRHEADNDENDEGMERVWLYGRCVVCCVCCVFAQLVGASPRIGTAHLTVVVGATALPCTAMPCMLYVCVVVPGCPSLTDSEVKRKVSDMLIEIDRTNQLAV